MSNTTSADLSNCDREPIHTPGSIQAHGTMLVCAPASFRLLFASDNAADMLGVQTAYNRGTPLSDIVGYEIVHELSNVAAKQVRAGSASVLLGVRVGDRGRLFDMHIHSYDNRFIIEFEPLADKGRSAAQALDLTQNLIQRISLESGVERIADTGAKLIRAMLGYDRVMVYRFLHNGAGRVIAESKSSALDSFLGQHFPSSDIPFQARRLYLINTIRMISDVSYVPIPLFPMLLDGEAPIDMSHAQLRSVSPIHCQYLKNMGVSASLSISIVVDGELWGLISCHHDTPKITPLALRIGAELFGQYFSLQISVAERRAALLAANQARLRLDAIIATLSSDAGIDALPEQLVEIAALIPCDGAGLWIDGSWHSYGEAVEKDVARALIDVARSERGSSIWAKQEIETLGLDPATNVAGVLAIPLSVTLGDYLMLFRLEESHNIEWAGKPDKQIVSTPQGERLTPRGSFETWRQEVRGRSTPWTDADLAVADAVRTYLRDVILRQIEASAEERARTEQRRRILNDELNHRVKNIIALVKSIALQTGATAASVSDYSNALEGRLRALAFAHDQSLGTAGGDLATLVDAEAGLHRVGGALDRVTMTGPPVALDNRAFGVVALATHELMTNAAKYGALSVPHGRLDVSWRLTDAGDCELLWDESGGPPVKPPARIGFGTKLIRATIEYDLRGMADVKFLPGGVRAWIKIPQSHVTASGAIKTLANSILSTEGILAGRSVLVVEDQGLIALDAEDMLRKMGAGEVHLAPNAEEAMRILESFEPDVAILDFNLGAETSEAIAEILASRDVPFVFVTGYSDSVMIPARFKNIPVLRKPISASSLAQKINLHRL